MRKGTLLVLSVVVFCAALLQAQEMAPASVSYDLVGSYPFQSNDPELGTWSATSQCTDNNGQVHAAGPYGGQISYFVVDVGSLTFDGHGNFTGSFTVTGYFDQAASDATVVITWSTDGNCTLLGFNSGYAVFDPPQNKSASGTYTINSGGAGTINSTNGIDFQSTGSFYKCVKGSVTLLIPTTIFMQFNAGGTPNLFGGTGIAQHFGAFTCPKSLDLARLHNHD